MLTVVNANYYSSPIYIVKLVFLFFSRLPVVFIQANKDFQNVNSTELSFVDS